MTARDILMSAGGGVEEKLYVDDVFSTSLYTGTGWATQAINNGIDLAGKGGLVWIKCRVTETYYMHNYLVDTVRGGSSCLFSNLTTGASASAEYQNAISFGDKGFSVGSGSNQTYNVGEKTYASWTFRKAPKFFDIVTYTGDGAVSKTIPHSLGIAPGAVVVKDTSAATDWPVYHRGCNGGVNPEQWYTALNLTAPQSNAVANWGNIAPTKTHFTVGGNNNVNGVTYVAYVFAHDPSLEGVIQCGQLAVRTTKATVDLGWEPQFVMLRKANGYGDWIIVDSMRDFTPATSSVLKANAASIESASNITSITSSGFTVYDLSNYDWIYVAIRRPNKPPKSGNQVFNTALFTSKKPLFSNAGFPVDLMVGGIRSVATITWLDRLRGSGYLTSAEPKPNQDFSSYPTKFDSNTGVSSSIWGSGYPMVTWNFKRAPGFFDMVMYRGSGSYPQPPVSHSLGVQPELMIFKSLTSDPQSTDRWLVWHKDLTSGSMSNASGATWPVCILMDGNSPYKTTNPGWLTNVNDKSIQPNQFYNSSCSYMAYMFASLQGVSKVGSYIGTGNAQTIDCGFTNGARFILIKRTDTTDDWYVWDSARGIAIGNEPIARLNNSGAEVTTMDAIDPHPSGFTVKNSGLTLSAIGSQYIYLAIA